MCLKILVVQNVFKGTIGHKPIEVQVFNTYYLLFWLQPLWERILPMLQEFIFQIYSAFLVHISMTLHLIHSLVVFYDHINILFTSVFTVYHFAYDFAMQNVYLISIKNSGLKIRYRFKVYFPGLAISLFYL